jgi:hypothetical protein
MRRQGARWLITRTEWARKLTKWEAEKFVPARFEAYLTPAAIDISTEFAISRGARPLIVNFAALAIGLHAKSTT